MGLLWKAGPEVTGLLYEVQAKHHKILEEAKFACVFDDSPPFTKGRFNWGKTTKFTPLAKLFHPDDDKADFLIRVCADSWASILNEKQREALLDLHLTRCRPEMLPVVVEENGKKKPVKDNWGRVQYSDEVKRDDEGNPKWQVLPLDIVVLQDNVARYGCWITDLMDFRAVIRDMDSNEKMTADKFAS